MKKKLRCAILAFSILVSGVHVFGSEILVFLNGQRLYTSSSPVIEDGTVMVPFRDIFEALGIEVEYNDSTKTITGSKDGLDISITIGNTEGYVNGQKKELSKPPQIVNGRTLVPLRFAAEAAGYPVEWDNVNKRVVIGTGSIKGDIALSSGSLVVNLSQLSETDGTGEFAGFKKLVGHPYEDAAEIYFKGNSGSYQVSTRLLDYNPNQLVTWKVEGETLTNKLCDIYEYFDVASRLYSSAELTDNYGSLYSVWLHRRLVETDAGRIVSKYLDNKDGVVYIDRFSTRDIKVDFSDAE